MSIIKKLASQTAIYGIPTMVGRFLNYLLVPIYLQKLSGTADYGVVSVMFTYASFMAIVVSLGMETAFFRFAKLTNEPARVLATASHTLIFLGLGFILATQWLAIPIMEFIGYPYHPEYAVWFAIILSADALASLGFAWLRQQNKAWKFATIRITNIGINIAANLFFLIVCPWLSQQPYFQNTTEHSPWITQFALWLELQSLPMQMVANIFISNLIASVITVLLFGKIWKNLTLGLDYDLLKPMLKYSLPLIIVGLAGMANETLDRIFLKNLLPSETADSEIGIYGAFYKLSLVLTLFIQAFRFAAEPFFFSKSGDKDAPQTYANVMRYFVYVTGGIFIVTMAIMPWLSPLLLRKPIYFQNSNGIFIIPILLLANLCLGLYYNLSIWYKLSGHTKMGAAVAGIGAMITIIGNYYGIPEYGFTASAVTTLAAYGFMVIVAYLAGQKFYPVPYQLPLLLMLLVVATLPITVLYYNPLEWGEYQLNVGRLATVALFATVIFLVEKWVPKIPMAEGKSKMNQSDLDNTTT